MLNQETAKAARTDSGYILRAPRRMRVADAVAQYMRVPMGAGNSVPWDPLVAPYVIEPMNCLASRSVRVYGYRLSLPALRCPGCSHRQVPFWR